MSKIIKLCKGLDIRLQGEAAMTIVNAPKASEYAVSPLDFEGVTPKMLVKVGDKVEAGSPLFFDKKRPEILFTSPVSGEVAAVNRGEKRKILSVVVAADAEIAYKQFSSLDLVKASREQIIDLVTKYQMSVHIKKTVFSSFIDNLSGKLPECEECFAGPIKEVLAQK